MKKIDLVVVGKLKERYFVDAANEYLKRLSRYADVTVHEIKDRSMGIKEECDDILSALKGYVILADIGGKEESSEGFSKLITTALENHDTLSFVIGGSSGVDGRVKSAADIRISFGRMTYPHMLMRVIALEQLYRAFTIKEGTPYHK